MKWLNLLTTLCILPSSLSWALSINLYPNATKLDIYGLRRTAASIDVERMQVVVPLIDPGQTFLVQGARHERYFFAWTNGNIFNFVQLHAVCGAAANPELLLPYMASITLIEPNFRQVIAPTMSSQITGNVIADLMQAVGLKHEHNLCTTEFAQKFAANRFENLQQNPLLVGKFYVVGSTGGYTIALRPGVMPTAAPAMSSWSASGGGESGNIVGNGGTPNERDWKPAPARTDLPALPPVKDSP